MTLATHCIPWDEHCTICNPSSPIPDTLEVPRETTALLDDYKQCIQQVELGESELEKDLLREGERRARSAIEDEIKRLHQVQKATWEAGCAATRNEASLARQLSSLEKHPAPEGLKYGHRLDGE